MVQYMNSPQVWKPQVFKKSKLFSLSQGVNITEDESKQICELDIDHFHSSDLGDEGSVFSCNWTQSVSCFVLFAFLWSLLFFDICFSLMFVQVEGSEDVLYAGTTSIDTQVVFIVRAVWNFFENSSVLVSSPVPKGND